MHMLQCMSPLVARNGRADRWPSCPLLEVYLPRQPMTAEAAADPERHFATINYRIAEGSFAITVGRPMPQLRKPDELS